MSEAIAFRGTDRMAEWQSGAVALSHRLHVTTLEANAEQQPVFDEDGQLALVFDGRLDNREELKKEIQRARLPVRDDTDPELVLRSYQLWREHCPGYLLGDFAFALWNANTRQLFCARDIIGAKPFYYYADERTFLFAAEMVGIARSGLLSLAPNEQFIAETLDGVMYSHSHTPFRDLQRLPGAHSLVITSNSQRVIRYWAPNPRLQIRYRDRRDYIAHGRELLTQAVACRMRSSTAIAVDVSGGMDSSTLGAISLTLAHADQAGPEVFAASMLFPDRDCDESTYVTDFARHTGMHSLRVNWTDANSTPDWRSEVNHTFDVPSDPTIWTPLMEAKAAAGARVTFCGVGGDEWFTGSRLCYQDMVANLRWGQYLKQVAADRRLDIFSWSELGRDTLRPWVPTAIRRWRLQRLGINQSSWVPPWIHPDLKRRIMEHRADVLPFRMPENAQEEMACGGFHPWMARAREQTYLHNALRGIEIRLPFHDRRVIEFCVAIPGEQHLYKGQNKYLLRQISSGLLPQSICCRADKAEFTSNLVNRLRTTGNMLNAPLLAESGWIHLSPLKEALHNVLRGIRTQHYYREVGALSAALSLECWLTQVFGRKSTIVCD